MTSRTDVRPIAWVTLQVCLSAGLVLSVRLESLQIASAGIALCGIFLSIWSVAVMRLRRLSVMPDVRTDSQLVTAGPYRRIRHPMYSGLALFTMGCSLAPGSWPKLLAWLVLMLVLHLKAQREETSLLAAFPEYADYRKRTRRFIPFLY
jgi:protein-S-isoprenylcysteine O-methyltransferase Ste14